MDPFCTTNNTEVYHDHPMCRYGRRIKDNWNAATVVDTRGLFYCEECERLHEVDRGHILPNAVADLQEGIRELVLNRVEKVCVQMDFAKKSDAQDAAYEFMYSAHKAVVEALWASRKDIRNSFTQRVQK